MGFEIKTLKQSTIGYFAAALIMLLIFFGIILVSVHIFNIKDRSIEFNNSNIGEVKEDISLSISPRGSSTDIWIKDVKEKDKDGKEINVRYAGLTYDITLTNKTSYSLENWTLKIPAPEDFYLNNAWCGQVEIIQTINGKQYRQICDLRKLSQKKEILTLDYRVEGSDLMIPISKNDYFIYHPSLKDNEHILPASEIKGASDSYKTIGLIIYTKIDEDIYGTSKKIKTIEFGDALLSFHLRMRMTRSPLFVIIVIAFVIWFILATNIFYTQVKTNSLEKQNERQKNMMLKLSIRQYQLSSIL